MSSYDAPAGSPAAPPPPGAREPQVESPPRVGTIVWGLIVMALAALIIVSELRLVSLNGSYVVIGLMIGAGAALVVGGLLSSRGRDKATPTRKS
ncbi:hypothetical protein QK292_06650 [Arthrobacter sp. AL08]|uniref:hypothetical protein n=1 Tax=Micrococcaceae TaxID=1268 RepID=UPI001CFF734C|nr:MULTISPECIES: hypothetical protein [Micrococcaceae]MCB5282156.1 hypothetical protein [Arthrobacter sp. ES1]MDI3241487.1 hypothetical protein [Arthrobacter sp. AL05]MDI3277256.1 hypothetical protein [Arthrobacter sp. AL08]MDJ0352768.1 hypothetical protein [Pseudarthrobacter sp. PH31-O2]WGZ78710.1 hypothetical protein QI450_12635 [Arthrobacter sp. EM1]